MSIRRIVVFIIILSPVFVYAQSSVAVGRWKTYFNYSAGCDVDRIDNNLYYASQSSVVSINLNDNSIRYIDKVEGLSDVGIQCMRANQTTKTVIICYNNSNIDLYQNGRVSNIPYLFDKQVTGDKTIYSIFPYDNYAYLACGFGIMVLDLKKKNVVDSWFFRQNSRNYPVKDLLIDKDGTIYAATDHALFKNKLGNQNIKDFGTWEQVTNINTPNNDCFKQLALLGEHLYLMKADTQTIVIDSIGVHQQENFIYSCKNNVWEKDTSFNFNEHDTNYTYQFIRSSLGKLIVGTNTGVKCYAVNSASNEVYTDNLYYKCGDPVTAICGEQNKLYVVLQGSGIFEGRLGEIYYYNITGPSQGAVSGMIWKNSKLIATHTIINGWVPSWDLGRISILEKGEWVTLYPFISGDNIHDLIGVAISPADNAVAFVTSFVQGMIEYNNTSLVRHFDNQNSSLDLMTGGTTRTVSPVFDKNNNLWLGNWGVSRPLVVRMANEKWRSFPVPFGGIQDVDKIFIDSRNTLWLICERERRLIIFNPNGTPDNTADDQWVNLNLSLPEEKGSFSAVYSVTEDKEGRVWIGTDKGVRVYQNPAQLFENQNMLPEAIYVTKDSLTEFVLNFEAIKCIKVDGGNRKWIGTGNGGVFLLSADGKEELFHFTTANSPLPSDIILSIEIDGETGEVYFGTDRGLISFRYTATDGKEKYDELKIFPNPVKEDFNGYISISGLKELSEVKITDAYGGLVYRTTSNGGTAVWDGKRFNGQKASTGVYFVFVSDESGKERKAGKILFIK
ncbi:MAG: T9SS type A sorting domain-containing protein [Bacteroidales bacterium]|jgi:hypothetical protein|nr:T9SS type A sorting domain-containing protein [Bacteroidales bacterium]